MVLASHHDRGGGSCKGPCFPSLAGQGCVHFLWDKQTCGGQQASSHPSGMGTLCPLGWRHLKVRGCRWPVGATGSFIRSQSKRIALSRELGTVRSTQSLQWDHEWAPSQPGCEHSPHRGGGIQTVSMTSDFCPFSSNSSNPLSDIRRTRRGRKWRKTVSEQAVPLLHHGTSRQGSGLSCGARGR